MTGWASGTALAISIEAGSNVGSIVNSGTIAATLTGAGQSATAIQIASDNTTLIANTGIIGAAPSNFTATNTPVTIAVDASAMTAGLTIQQTAHPDEDASEPSMRGDIFLAPAMTRSKFWRVALMAMCTSAQASTA